MSKCESKSSSFWDTDVFNVSVENWVSFLDPMIESWDIDLRTFSLEIALNCRLAPDASNDLSLWKSSRKKRLSSNQAWNSFSRMLP